MVEVQLRDRGIADERVLEAMGEVPRELFVPEEDHPDAYADRALSIAHGQTISQPWIVAAICQALQLGGRERVLEIGSGSGYSAAVLSRLAREVTGIERIEALAHEAVTVLAGLGVENVEILVGDGTLGLPGSELFDAIAVHAAAPAPPRSLLSQLAPGGRLVVPVKTPGGESDTLTLYERPSGASQGGLRVHELGPSRFVPLIGDEGFDE